MRKTYSNSSVSDVLPCFGNKMGKDGEPNCSSATVELIFPTNFENLSKMIK